MEDNDHTGRPGDVMISLEDSDTIEYLHVRFPDKTHNEIKAAIITAGPYRKDVIAYLERS